MTPHDTETFARALYVLGEVFNTAVSPVRAHAYFEALADLPLEAVLAAMKTHVKAATFFPKPGELRAAITGKAEDQAELAWMKVVTLMRRVGSYQYPAELKTDVAMSGAVEACGGWVRLCLSEDELTFVATNFKRAYGALQRREQINQALPAWLVPKAIGDGGPT